MTSQLENEKEVVEFIEDLQMRMSVLKHHATQVNQEVQELGDRLTILLASTKGLAQGSGDG